MISRIKTNKIETNYHPIVIILPMLPILLITFSVNLTHDPLFLCTACKTHGAHQQPILCL